MIGELSLKAFIKLASDPEEYKVKIDPRGNIKVEKTAVYSGKIAKCFSLHKDNRQETIFSYEVYRSISQTIYHGDVNGETNEKVKQATRAIFRYFNNQWEELNEHEIATLHSLPNFFSLNAMDCREVQQAEALDILNNHISNTIGIDLMRFIHNQSLVVRLIDNSTYVIHRKKDFLKFIIILGDIFHLPKKIIKSLKEKGTNLNSFFSDLCKSHQCSDMLHFLNGLSQSAYSQAATIIPRIYGEIKRLQFAPGCHDNALIRIDKNNQIEVRHYFHLLFQKKKAIIRTDTLAIFDLFSKKWTSYSISFSPADAGCISRAEKKILIRLNKLGY